MKPKRLISITIFGILAIIWGIIILYHFIINVVGKPWTVLRYDWIQWISSSFSTIFALVLAAGFIISGFGLLKLKPWSRYSLLITVGLALWGLVNRLIVLGPCTEEYFYLISFGTAALFIWFLNRKSIREIFPYCKSLKVITVIWITILSLEILGAGIIWFKYGGYKIPKLQKAVYKSKDESFYSKNYFRSPFPFKYSLAIPNGFNLYSISKNGNLGIIIFLTIPKKGFIIMNNEPLIYEMQFFKVFGFNDPYRFTKKFFSERYGLIFTILKLISMSKNICRVEEAQINGLNGFIQKCSGKTWMSEYYLFQGHQPIGGGIIAIKKDKSFNKQQIDEIISSIRLQNKPLKSAQEFFQEGVELFNQRKFEKAKFSFASALCLDWQNPQYHYYLGYAFLKTENLNLAKKHVEIAISLQHDYPEAQKLLDEIKSREKNGK